MLKEIKDEAQRHAEAEARKIMALAIERLASEFSAERNVTIFPLTNPNLKGRIIGHEGKNIRAFEKGDRHPACGGRPIPRRSCCPASTR